MTPGCILNRVGDKGKGDAERLKHKEYEEKTKVTKIV
jgi:hypothetical protein